MIYVDIKVFKKLKALFIIALLVNLFMLLYKCVD